MNVKKIGQLMIFTLPFFMLAGCEDPFYENSVDMMPGAGYQATQGQATQHHKSATPVTTSNAPVKKAATEQTATSTAADTTPAVNATPIIPDSPPMI